MGQQAFIWNSPSESTPHYASKNVSYTEFRKRKVYMNYNFCRMWNGLKITFDRFVCPQSGSRTIKDEFTQTKRKIIECCDFTTSRNPS